MSVPEATVPEKRRSIAMCNLEPTLHRIATDLVGRMDITMSSYLRKLIIDDLRTKGLLPDALLAKLYINRS